MENINKPSTSIKNWAVDDRPREKLSLKGAAVLSDSELLAILIANGSKEKSAVQLAKEVLQLGGHNLNELGKLSLKELQKIKGIGIAKAITIAAALEIGRRRHASAALEKTVIKTSSDIAQYLRATIKDFSYEVFAVLFLNKANKINHFEIISRGGLTGTVADPRVILKIALEQEATSIILCHNHPSGNLRPSRADEELTQKIKTAARYLDILMMDHLIVSEEGYYSFADGGLL
ncbi:DNA repair protein RadC [Ferruginibacter paludis]|uniref:RadC family protein n=1 Tax=Ferruginibacter paludis TaxID=1310417 RepID=UPI0025B367CA|nr:DNA repair protein RadC [Ferruginibacter paludis]MDN3658711.1 DNA repair protein RadC [Ferruginibacter paludis]